MKICLLAVLLVGLVATTCIGSDLWLRDNQDTIMITLAPGYPFFCLEMGAFETVYLYLSIVNPSQPVAALSCTIFTESDTGYVGFWTANEGWVNAATQPDLDLTVIGDPLQSDVVVVAEMVLIIVNVTIPIEFYIEPPAGHDVVTYLGPSGEPVELSWATGGPTVPSFIINPEYGCLMWDADEALAWSAVKALYR